ncbi:MAG: ABC transporter permease [Nanoarchaeota archaeon]|nr:ABC transporter permease [Nanoarchaeota archaeon]
MKWHRINALLMRHLYLYRRSLPRIMDIFYWPVMELLLWGFLSLYLARLEIANFNAVTFLLGGIIFWDLLSQSQRVVSVAFLEEVWERNLLNLFVTPLKMKEFLASTVILGLVRIFVVSIIMAGLAFLFYSFNIFTFGLFLIPFMANLLLFGWILGLLTTAIILRYGSSAQVLAFGLIFLLQPFSAVFYPVSILPQGVQYVANILPSTHVFEGMRAVINTGTLPLNHFLWAVVLNLLFLGLILVYFYRMFAWVKRSGKLMKLD